MFVLHMFYIIFNSIEFRRCKSLFINGATKKKIKNRSFSHTFRAKGAVLSSVDDAFQMEHALNIYDTLQICIGNFWTTRSMPNICDTLQMKRTMLHKFPVTTQYFKIQFLSSFLETSTTANGFHLFHRNKDLRKQKTHERIHSCVNSWPVRIRR